MTIILIKLLKIIKIIIILKKIIVAVAKIQKKNIINKNSNTTVKIKLMSKKITF
jgi:hypothetical protein